MGAKRQATVIRPDAGEEAAVVAVCATCHWPYWSQRWSHCVNCEAKRDEITKLGPKIWDPKKVQVHYGAGKKAEPKAAARAKARPAPPAVQGRFAESRPATTTGRAAMFSMDADEAEEDDDDMLSDMEVVAEVQESEDGVPEAEEEAVLPSGLTPYWVKFLLRQGMAAAKAYRDQMGFESEVDIDKRFQL